MEILNRKARYEYFIIEEYTCGIELKGSEIKSIRKGNTNINDCYGRVKNKEIFLINMFIAKYDKESISNIDERRERKLLLHKKEIIKIEKEIKLNHYTLIPLKIFIYKGKAKILLGLCKGKKKYDKRDHLKERDLQRKLNEYKNRH